MEKIDEKTIRKVAEISRLRLSEEEIREIGKEMEKILEHFSAIKGIKKEKEMYYVHEMENPLKKDKKESVREEDSEAIRSQFTKKEGKHLVAPKTIK